MNIETHHQDDITVIGVRGSLTMECNAGAVREKLSELADAGCRRVVVDLAEITDADSAGLAELVAGYIDLAAAGGRMTLLRPSPPMQDLLDITRLSAVLDVYVDEASAVRSLSAGWFPSWSPTAPAEVRSEFFLG